MSAAKRRAEASAIGTEETQAKHIKTQKNGRILKKANSASEQRSQHQYSTVLPHSTSVQHSSIPHSTSVQHSSASLYTAEQYIK